MGTNTKRTEAVVVNEILKTYGALSPENLNDDSEVFFARANKLHALFTEIGREMSEDEAYRWIRSEG